MSGYRIYNIFFQDNLISEYYAPINVMPEGGGPQDEVGTLKVRASPTWGILANFEHTCWPQGWEV